MCRLWRERERGKEGEPERERERETMLYILKMFVSMRKSPAPKVWHVWVTTEGALPLL